jgi:hypothetical protein
MDIQEYIIASIKIPIRLIDGGKSTSPCQERCQIEFYRCDNLDEFPENNSLESNAIMSKFSQFFSSTVDTRDAHPPSVESLPPSVESLPPSVQPSHPPTVELPRSIAPFHKEITVSKKYPSKQKTFRVHQCHGSSMRFTRRAPI